MKKNTEIIIQKFAFVSRRLFWSACASFLLAGILAQVTFYSESRWTWFLEFVICRPLFIFAFLAIPISMLIPGLLFVSLHPELGHAWLRGINPIWYNKPWEQLSDFAKFWTFLDAIISFVCGVLIISEIIKGWFR